MAAVTVLRLRVPGDKSLSHRALMFAALADGRSRLRGVLPSADVRSTAGVLAALGVDVATEWDDADEVIVVGRGVRGLQEPSTALDCGNSGTTTRLMAGIVAGHLMTATFTGDESLSRRPMRRVARPLAQMGARFVFARDDGLPMTICGGALRALSYASPTASAQVKSALLLAGLVGGVPVRVDEPQRSRDHTERLLAAQGATLVVDDDGVALEPGGRLAPLALRIPGDPSSAIFPLALALLLGRAVLVERVLVNPTRTGALRVLARMGAPVARLDETISGGEPVAELAVERVPGLRGTNIGGDEIPSLIDELPMLACLAARAEGETVISDATELRVKESDRIAAVVSNLRAIGADADERPDGLVVRGSPRPLAGRVTTHGDHRIAMAFGVLAALPGNDIAIDDRECVRVSYPGFWAQLAHVATSA
ncbi:MAG: 3-phosphoshikimate 1-carboxyvinyltransferase [Gemmatimonadaceae bacterium]|nr:3-phosphoshikimate 1-carboxyvinyltransferase [Gemmatimonadaceae bacterium]MCU0626340.1 3-phosphoshikimate 1-carboxyvinyltransferase [Gemmatimonadaceae bacterium]